jgi:hypothetical protein
LIATTGVILNHVPINGFKVVMLLLTAARVNHPSSHYADLFILQSRSYLVLIASVLSVMLAVQVMITLVILALFEVHLLVDFVHREAYLLMIFLVVRIVLVLHHDFVVAFVFIIHVLLVHVEVHG